MNGVYPEPSIWTTASCTSPDRTCIRHPQVKTTGHIYRRSVNSPIQRPKIDDISVDYLTLLRDGVITGRAPVSTPNTQHLDGAWYWKMAFDKAQEEKKALLDKLCDFERQKNMTTLSSSPAAASPLTRDRKRRREETPAAKANSRSKRRANTLKASDSLPENDVPNGHEEASVADEVASEFRCQCSLQSLKISRWHRKAPTGILCFAYGLATSAT